MTRGWGYALCCIVVPAVWGWAMVRVFAWWERRTGRDRRPVDYAI